MGTKSKIIKGGVLALEEAYKSAKAAEALAESKKMLSKPREGVWNGEGTLPDWKAKQQARMAEENKQKFLEPSKVKQRMYHGTNKDITAFDPSKAGENYGMDKEGMFFTSNPQTASIYAAQDPYEFGGTRAGANVMPVHLSLKNPLVINSENASKLGLDTNFNEGTLFDNNRQKIMYLAKKGGYDGVQIGEDFIAFSPNQIKSATGNQGTYDITNPDITKAHGGIVHMAGGGQEFPLQKPANVTDADMTPNEIHPFAGALSRGLSSVHNFVSKPFGYDNPPAEMVSDLIGIPSFAKVLDNYAYGTPSYSGSGQATRLNEEATDAAMSLPFGTAQSAIKLAKRSAPIIKKAAMNLAPTAADMMEAELRKYGMINDIIKHKGGNWMPGSPEQMTNNLKKSTIHTMNGQSPSESLADIEKIWPEELPDSNGMTVSQQVEEAFPMLKRDAAIEKWVDQKLNKYIKNEMGTESDPIRLGIERRYAEAQELRKANQKRLDKMADDIETARAAGKSTTQSERRLELAKEQFAEEEDIAFNGLYHGTIPEGGWQNFESWYFEDPIKEKRARVGMPTEGLATHPAAKLWESTVDDEIRSHLASDLKAPHLKDTLLIKENPWLNNLADDARIHKIDTVDANLEFRHMIDELKAAMDPTSNLPKHLKITPKDLEKMTVDDVSALSGKINGWRNVQKTKTNLEVANNPATHTFKEYPEEINPNGVSWKQIKLPKGLPEEEAKKAVRDATRYEGDLMDHCVDTHCERLLAGQTELYTLRDDKGRPHVTIEVEPQKEMSESDRYKYRQKLNDQMQDYFIDNPNATYDEAEKYVLSKNTKTFAPPRILEIKGRNNRKPKPEYMPFVQDFIKSGNWSDIGDMHHTDLQRTKGTAWRKIYEDAGMNIPDYVSMDEYDDIVKQYNQILRQNKNGKAEGGAVHMADGGEVHWIDHLKNQLASGGQPEANDSDWIDQLRSQVSAEVKKEMGNDNDKYRSEAQRLLESERRGFSPRFQGFGFPTSVDIHRPYPIVEGAHVRGMVDVPIDRAQFSLGASSNVINTPEALLFTPHSRHMEARMPVGKGNLTFSGMQNPKFGQKDLRLMYEQQFAYGGLAK